MAIITSDPKPVSTNPLKSFNAYNIEVDSGYRFNFADVHQLGGR